jgi:N-acetylneuraminic acid mutarotase
MKAHDALACALALAVAVSAGCGGGDTAANGDAALPEDGAVDDRYHNCQATTAAGCTAEEPWRCDPPLPVQVQEIQAAVLGGRIYVAGGFQSVLAIVPTVHVFDPSTGEWCEGPPLPEPRHHMALVAHDGDLYALGGMQTLAFTPLSTAWVLRSGAAAWEPIAPLPAPRASGAAGVIGGKIYLAAGVGDGDGCDLTGPTFIYDPATDTWEDDGPAIPTPREHVAAVVHGGELFVFGGRLCGLDSHMPTVEAFDPEAGDWRTLPDMPTSRGGLGAALLDGVAYVSGGEETQGAFDAFEALDLSLEQWQAPSPPPVPTPRHGHASVAHDGRVYVLGGADEPIFSAVAAVESFAP